MARGFFNVQRNTRNPAKAKLREVFYNGEGMAKTLEFYQIYFEDGQLKHLYPFAIPYKNTDLTLYFENSY